MPYFSCPECHARVHVLHSYTRQVTCPVCAGSLTRTKSVPADLDSWLADRVRDGAGRHRPDDGRSSRNAQPVL